MRERLGALEDAGNGVRAQRTVRPRRARLRRGKARRRAVGTASRRTGQCPQDASMEVAGTGGREEAMVRDSRGSPMRMVTSHLLGSLTRVKGLTNRPLEGQR